MLPDHASSRQRLTHILVDSTKDPLGGSSVKEQGFEAHQLTTQQVRHIFQERCKGLAIDASAVRERRFLGVLQKGCCGGTLKLASCQLGEHGGVALAKALVNNHSIRTLILGENDLRDAGAIALAEVLMRNQSITSVDLHSNAIGSDGSCALLEALWSSNDSVEVLDLSSNGVNRNRLGIRGAHLLNEVLLKNKTLRSLSLSHHGLGAEGMGALTGGMSSNKWLTILDLASNDLGRNGFDLLFRALEKNPDCVITDLHLSKNNAGPGGGQAVARFLALPSCPVTRLDIGGNKFGGDGGTAIAYALQTNKSLTSLNLEDNRLDLLAIKILGVALRESNRTLTSLILGNNQLDGKAAAEIGDILKVNNALLKLDLGLNKLGNEGAALIGQAMAVNTGLASLDLYKNNIHDAGGVPLAKGLLQNRTLQKISLRDNMLQGDTAEILRDVALSNENLLSFDISYNDICFKDHKVIEQAVKAHLKKYADGAEERYRREIKRLREQEVRLVETKKDIVAEQMHRVEWENQAQVAEDELQIIRKEKERRYEELQEALQVVKTLIQAAEAEIQAKTLEISQIRADVEMKATILQAKVQREAELRFRAERQVCSLIPPLYLSLPFLLFIQLKGKTQELERFLSEERIELNSLIYEADAEEQALGQVQSDLEFTNAERRKLEAELHSPQSEEHGARTSRLQAITEKKIKRAPKTKTNSAVPS